MAAMQHMDGQCIVRCFCFGRPLQNLHRGEHGINNDDDDN